MNEKAPLQGYDPVFQTVSDFQQGEFQGVQTPKINAIKLNVSAELQRRKVYCWLWADVTNASDYWAQGVITFHSNNTKVGEMPVSVAIASLAQSPLSNSLPTVCTSGGSGGLDTIGLFICNPQGGQPASVSLQPLYLYGKIDEIRFSLNSVRNVSTTAGLGVRCWLGVISSQ